MPDTQAWRLAVQTSVYTWQPAQRSRGQRGQEGVRFVPASALGAAPATTGRHHWEAVEVPVGWCNSRATTGWVGAAQCARQRSQQPAPGGSLLGPSGRVRTTGGGRVGCRACHKGAREKGTAGGKNLVC